MNVTPQEAFVTRRFTLLDGMILVAACAAGFSCTKLTIYPILLDAFSGPILGPKILSSGISTLPVLLALTIAVVPLRLRNPRPACLDCFRQPGFVAGVAACLGLLGVTARVATLLIYEETFHMQGLRNEYDYPGTALFFLVIKKVLPTISHAVILSWILLALSGRWRAERGWIDQLGRILGALWVLGLPFFYWLSVIR